MYVCGITPYDAGHLGHALTYVVFDVVRRYLEFQSFEVEHIQNITDVDDDMVRVSGERGLSIAELTEETHTQFLRDMDALNVLRPDAYPRVSGSIPEIIALISLLLERGHAYEVEGHVFFEAESAPAFGALAGMTADELRNAPRTDTMPQEPEHLKRDTLDFLLWQPSDYPGAAFDAPWGRGRPGWHIECSAMARANLGDRIDIHGGGSDLIYPHHESEIVQSQYATGAEPFVGYWMHIGTLTLDGVKMSKSLGNLVKVGELLEAGHEPDAIRLALLGTHYREEHPWTDAVLERAGEQAALLHRAAASPGGPCPTSWTRAAPPRHRPRPRVRRPPRRDRDPGATSSWTRWTRRKEMLRRLRSPAHTPARHRTHPPASSTHKPGPEKRSPSPHGCS